MGLIQRMKSWLRPHSSETDADGASQWPSAGTAVAGFVKRAPADVEIIASVNTIRSLATLMPPAVAAAAPLRTIPLFLVSNHVEPADVAIVQIARAAPKLHLVHNVASNGSSDVCDAGRFLLAARLASVAHLNTRAGQRPVTKPARNICSQRCTVPTRAKKLSVKQTTAAPVKCAAAKTATQVQCFVRVQSSGTAAVISVPRRAKRRAA